MKMRRKVAWGLLLPCLLVMLAACGTPEGPQIETEDVWARPAMMMDTGGTTGEGMGQGYAGTGAVFMALKNKGGEADRLIGGKTEVARVVEIHETVMEGEIMKMRMLADGLEVPVGGTVLLKPGGYHVMLIDIQRELRVGDSFALELQFEKSGTLTVEPEVRQP